MIKQKKRSLSKRLDCSEEDETIIKILLSKREFLDGEINHKKYRLNYYTYELKYNTSFNKKLVNRKLESFKKSTERLLLLLYYQARLGQEQQEK